MDKSSRNLGLDIARSVAIISVLVSHSKSFATSYDLRFLSIGGLLGVEIFFVLSGFLIGQIIIKSLVNNPSINSLKNFYIRRWFRTLPVYYLILFVVAMINNSWIPERNFVFLQNFNEDALGFLAVSWSLSVEEWFYLLFPLILIICLNVFDKKMDRKKIFFLVSIIIALSSFLLRSYISVKYNPSWDYGVRKQVFLRMDSMMFGVVLAGINIYYENFYKKITSSIIPMIVSCSGFIVIGIINIGYSYSGDLNNSLCMKTFMFSFISLVCMFFIAQLESSLFINKTLKQYKISKIFNLISVTSYGIYLVHWVVYGLVIKTIQGLKGALIAITITLIISWLLHILYEVPIMNLRDKIKFRGKRIL